MALSWDGVETIFCSLRLEIKLRLNLVMKIGFMFWHYYAISATV
jgi:hypothetical protein